MKILILTISLSLCMLLSRAQIINTIAGIGTPGSSGNGGQATLCEFFYPIDITNDNLGNTYICDNGNHEIRKIDLFGVISHFASISLPSAITCDKNNNIYVASQGEMSVVKFSPSGIRTTIAGKCDGIGAYSGDGGIATLAALNYPYGIAIDNLNNLYIATTGDGRIRKVDTLGIINTICGNGINSHTGDGGFANLATIGVPRGICIDRLGNLFIAEQGSCCIRKINTLGMISTIGGLGNGSHNYIGDGGIATLAELCPVDVFVDSIGNIYLSDAGNQVIRKIDLSGIITTIVGNGSKLGPGGSAGIGSFSGDGGLPTLATLNDPWGLFMDKQGALLIADWFNHRIRKVSNPVVSIDDLNLESIIFIFPNPSFNNITISSTIINDVNFEITDELGKVVLKNKRINPNNYTIDINNLSRGIYFIRLQIDNRIAIKKFIKE